MALPASWCSSCAAVLHSGMKTCRFWTVTGLVLRLAFIPCARHHWRGSKEDANKTISATFLPVRSSLLLLDAHFQDLFQLCGALQLPNTPASPRRSSSKRRPRAHTEPRGAVSPQHARRGRKVLLLPRHEGARGCARAHAAPRGSRRRHLWCRAPAPVASSPGRLLDRGQFRLLYRNPSVPKPGRCPLNYASEDSGSPSRPGHGTARTPRRGTATRSVLTYLAARLTLTPLRLVAAGDAAEERGSPARCGSSPALRPPQPHPHPRPRPAVTLSKVPVAPALTSAAGVKASAAVPAGAAVRLLPGGGRASQLRRTPAVRPLPPPQRMRPAARPATAAPPQPLRCGQTEGWGSLRCLIPLLNKNTECGLEKTCLLGLFSAFGEHVIPFRLPHTLFVFLCSMGSFIIQEFFRVWNNCPVRTWNLK